MNARRKWHRMTGRGLRALGAAGFVLACISLAANLAMLRRAPVMPAPPTAGITRWSDLEPDRPQAFAANLRALGAPESAIHALLGEAGDENEHAEIAPAAAAANAANAPAPPRNGMPTAAALPKNQPAPASSFALSAPQPQTIAQQQPELAVASSTFAAVSSSDSPRLAGQRRGPGNRIPGGVAMVAVGGGGFSGGPLAISSNGATNGAAAVANESAAPDDSAILAPSSDSKIPVAFEPLSPDLKLTASQKEKVKHIQDEFAQQVDGGQSAPPTPKQWQQAVTLADEEFRASFGDPAFLAQQLHALHSDNTSP